MSEKFFSDKHLNEAVKLIRKKTDQKFDVGIITGSGLGSLKDYLPVDLDIPFDHIPGIKKTGVKGHQGSFLTGSVENNGFIIQNGRLHRYEGLSYSDILFPLRIMIELGVRLVIITCASGGIRPDLTPGEIVLVSDHINLSGTSPLTGIPDEGERSRFVNMAMAYDPVWMDIAARESDKVGLSLKRCVYAAVAGPCYETPAEIRMISALGGEIVGMSLIGETMLSRYYDLKVLAFSCVTNVHTDSCQTSHVDVLAEAKKSAERLGIVIKSCISHLSSPEI